MEQSEIENDLSCFQTDKSLITNLIQNIFKMSKKIDIEETNLSQILDEFEKFLHDKDQYIANGILDFNFAEAALLLQSSAEIYGKKVDLLWDFVINCNRQLVEIEGNSKNKELLEEKIQKFKRKRRRNDVLDQNISSKTILRANEVSDFLSQSQNRQCNLMNEWHKFEKENLNYNNASEEFKDKIILFPPEKKIYNENKEYIGRYDQLHSSFLIEEIFRTQTNGIFKGLPIMNEGDVIQNQRHSLRSNCYVRLEMLPTYIIQEKLRKLGISDLIIEQSFSINATCENESFCNLVKENISCSKDSAFFDCDDEASNVELGDNSSIVTSEIIKKKQSLPCSFTVSVIKPLKEQKAPDKIKSKLERINKRTSKNKLLKLCSSITVPMDSFENFYTKQYLSADNEGSSQTRVEDSDTDFEDSAIEDNENDSFENNHSCEEQLEYSPLRDIKSQRRSIFENKSLQQEDSDNGNYDNNVQSQCETFESDNLANEEISRKNVIEWRNFIEPVLRKLEKKSDFDIHLYSTKIINCCDKNAARKFGDIVSNMKSSQVVRYFISTLQLANSGNVKISDVQSGTLSNDTLTLTLINEKQHFETLIDYEAPSTELLKNKLKQMGKRDLGGPSTSTPHSSLPAKRFKFNISRKLNLLNT